MTVKNILIVDDSRTEQLYLSDILVADGYTVHVASDAQEAEKALEMKRPDLILLDVVMPGLNGFQFARALTRDEKYMDIPIIICSSKNQETDRVWGMRQGAKAYLVKPVQKAELLKAIRAI